MKKVNLVYGLNGSGKSTIGRFLRNPQDVIYSKCSLQGAVGAKFIVFNEDFIRENFFESSSVPGIFSLSKKNSEAERIIANAYLACQRKNSEAERIIANASEAIDDISRKISADDLRKMEDLSKIKKEKETAIDKIFDIKRKYSGGDRVLDYCLEGVLTNKDKLYDRLSSFNFSGRPPEYTVTDLQGEARLLSADSEAREELLPKFVFNVAELENHEAFKIPIVGVLSGEFGEFINKLKHSDWVREGERYIDKDSASPSPCPFCQEKNH
ncbi:AAA family ATPase [Xanthomonas arboricola]|uniref:AAA family ATPase n=1 Tax=Xanthomonas arboricola TaxID=56448 RepID=UPI0023AA1BBA|nr:AAA family ATPase [Xanthomonas arboricola]